MQIIGAGGHARVIFEVCMDNQKIVSRIHDDNPSVRHFYGYSVSPIHSIDQLSIKDSFFLAIGDNGSRYKKYKQLCFLHYETLIHSSAMVSPTAQIGDGTVVIHRAVIQAEVQVGKQVIINTGAQLGHDCVVDDFCHVAPGAILCGGVKLNRGVFVGAGAILVQGIEIGENTTIGAGTVVTRSIPSNQVMVGNPAREVKKLSQEQLIHFKY